MTHITLAVTGSISAYKAAGYYQPTNQIGFEVKVPHDSFSPKIYLLNPAGSFKNPVGLEVMVEDDPQRIEHIDIGKETDPLSL